MFKKNRYDEPLIIQKIKDRSILNQDVFEIAYDVLRVLEGIESRKMKAVIEYLNYFYDDYLVVDFDKSVKRFSFEEIKEE